VEESFGSLASTITVERPLLKVQRSVASQDDEWQVPAAAVIGPGNLTGCSQSSAALRPNLLDQLQCSGSSNSTCGVGG
jgi:hypothetical protein